MLRARSDSEREAWRGLNLKERPLEPIGADELAGARYSIDLDGSRILGVQRVKAAICFAEERLSFLVHPLILGAASKSAKGLTAIKKPSMKRRMRIVERTVEANGIPHFLAEFGEGERTLVAAHGFLDQAYGFLPLAKALAPYGVKVLAFDFRGHGRSGWAPPGGYYHFPDYLADMDALFEELMGDAPINLLGHSMGGTAVGLYAGARPERIEKLVLLEGLGPPELPIDEAPARMRAFLDGIKKARSKEHAGRPMEDARAALKRMRRIYPDIADDPGLMVAEKNTRALESGERVFRYDPLHQTRSPTPYRADLHLALLREIEAETLIIHGSRGFRHPPEEEARREAAIANRHRVIIDDAGHMLHLTHPEAVAAAIGEFL